jgi:uncharacterized protein (TIGR03435 family)
MRALLLLLLLFLPSRDGYGAAGPEFDVATIKLNTTVPDVIDVPPSIGGSFHFQFDTLRALIATAYKLHPFEILGGPSWIASNRYDVEARSSAPKISDDDFRQMMQNLLADRFMLKVHPETRQLTAYTLVPRVTGPWAPKTPTSDCCGSVTNTRKGMEGSRITMRQLIAALTNILAAPVTDGTNYTAPFDVQLEFTREGAPVTDDSLPSIFTAIQEQLGLRLEAHKAPAEVLVVDHAEKPTDN